MLDVATSSFNRAISEHRLADGSFSGASPAITAAAFGVELGMTYIRLDPRLDSGTRARWQETLAGIADFLISDHDATWYANGNINSSYAGALYFAWRATGAGKYLEAYNAELEFMVAPPGHLWEGFGLTITHQPTAADGSDGRGFLTEGSPPGWDPEYSHLQLDFLSALYSASGDPRVLRLLNLILNQELTRVDPATFILDARGGTRKNETMAFTSAALPLLVIDGERPDLAPLLPAAFARLASEYHATLKYTEHNFYRGVALWLAPILLATSGLPYVPAPVGAVATPSPSSPTAADTGSPAPPRQAPKSSGGTGAPPRTSRRSEALTVSPRALHASKLERVRELEIPGSEYAFASASALTRGLVVTGKHRARVAVAAFVCASTCTLSVRALLVIHRGGKDSPVATQEFLRATSNRLRRGQVDVRRVVVPGIAVRATRRGQAVYVRLIVLLHAPGMPPQGRSYSFRLRTNH